MKRDLNENDHQQPDFTFNKICAFLFKEN